MDCTEITTIATLTDLVTWIEPRLGETGSREVAERMADELRRYDDRPVWGADWSAFLRKVCEDGRFEEERRAAENMACADWRDQFVQDTELAAEENIKAGLCPCGADLPVDPAEHEGVKICQDCLGHLVEVAERAAGWDPNP